ncbi:MAG: hypothetical protein ACYDA1_00130 [Vulcanimicrobiaceae bacterium]
MIAAEGDDGLSWLASEGRTVLLNEGINSLDQAVMQRLFPARSDILVRISEVSLDIDCFGDDEMELEVTSQSDMESI